MSVEPFLATRHGLQDDAIEMGGMAYRAVDLELERAAYECRRILREPFAFSAVVTQSIPPRSERIVGVLNGILLKPWFSARLFEGETPYFHRHVETAISSPFPDDEEIGRANAGEGLDLFLAHFAVDEAFDDAEAIRIRGLLVSYFVDQFSGNRLRSILVETVGRENTAMAMNSGFEVVTSYPSWRAANNSLERDGPHLLRMDLHRTLEVQNFHLARLLQYRTPLFHFPPGARELLRFALQGLTDVQLVSARSISSKSIASTWTRIYRIVEEVMPNLLPSGLIGKPDRRLALMAYLRNHPEELWPYGRS